MTALYPRPLICDPATPGARPLAGGWAYFAHVQLLSRSAAPRILPADDLPEDVLAALTRPRPGLAGLSFDAPRLMGILNVTPDSFSDGGRFTAPDAALAQAKAMARADIFDVGGESTRPGATDVAVQAEIDRVVPVIAALSRHSDTPISIDTRKAQVAQAALHAGAHLVNDVSGLDYDPRMADFLGQTQAPVCLMHAQGTPQTMQANPQYDDVVLDVFDALAAKRDRARAAGLPADRILLDPGIGFGKTESHNLTLIRNLSLFHALGCPLLLGVSRKGFIGKIGRAPDPADRAAGSIAVGLAGVAQGVQVLRVHDVEDTAQALALWRATQQMGTI